jgi:hypothetical protein
MVEVDAADGILEQVLEPVFIVDPLQARGELGLVFVDVPVESDRQDLQDVFPPRRERPLAPGIGAGATRLW